MFRSSRESDGEFWLEGGVQEGVRAKGKMSDAVQRIAVIAAFVD